MHFRYVRTLDFSLPLFALISLFLIGEARAQSIEGYQIIAENDVFQRELNTMLLAASPLDGMPVLDCSIEYLRRFNAEEIVLRRGPIPLSQHTPQRNFSSYAAISSEPTSEFSISDKSMFIGGLLVDMPRPGDAENYIPDYKDDSKYMMRVALIPQSYTDNYLYTTILIERAVVRVSADSLTVLKSEVFSRVLRLRGNLPMNFAMPTWEAANAQEFAGVVPPGLDESLLVTLETPRDYGISRNYPDPFANRTRLSYSVPQSSRIRLTVRIEGKDSIIDEGKREPGVYHVVWDAENVQDGIYIATLEARDQTGQSLHSTELELHKSKAGSDFQPKGFLALSEEIKEPYQIGVESGVVHVFPQVKDRTFADMFTRFAVRLGYRVNSSFEVGAVLGKETFHETIPEGHEGAGDIGPVSPGYAGFYGKVYSGQQKYQPVAQLTLAMTDKNAPLIDVSVGFRTSIFNRVDIYLMPSVMVHLSNEISTKVGLTYGAKVAF